MEMKIKQIKKGDKVLMGVVNSKLETIIPFEYDKIELISAYENLKGKILTDWPKLFQCTSGDNQALYDYNGNIIIGLDQGLIFGGVLDAGYSDDGKYTKNMFIKAFKGDEVGIIKVSFDLKHYSYKNSIYDSKYEVVYDFGKVDFIEKKEIGIILTKFYYNDPLSKDKPTDMKYGYFHYQGTETIIEPCNAVFKDAISVPIFSFKGPSHKKADLIIYNDKRKEKIGYGMLQRVGDSYEELFPYSPSHISYNCDAHGFMLEQGYFFSDHPKTTFVGTAYNTCGSRPIFKPIYRINLGNYYEVMSQEYPACAFKVIRKGKCGLIASTGNIAFNGDEKSLKEITFCKNKDYTYKTAIPFEYDDITCLDGRRLFVAEKDGIKTLYTVIIDVDKVEIDVAVRGEDYTSIETDDKVYYIARRNDGKCDLFKRIFYPEQSGKVIKKVIEGADDISHIAGIYKIVNENDIKVMIDTTGEIHDGGCKDIYVDKNGNLLILKESGEVVCHCYDSKNFVKFQLKNGLTLKDVSIDFYPGIKKAKVSIKDKGFKLYDINDLDTQLSFDPDIKQFEVYPKDGKVCIYSGYESRKPYTIVSHVISHVVTDDGKKVDKLVKYVDEIGDYAIEYFAADNSRCIVKKSDGKKVRYGVLDNINAKLILDIAYDHIIYDENKNQFICINGPVETSYDIDGFEIINGIDPKSLNVGGHMRNRQKRDDK